MAAQGRPYIVLLEARGRSGSQFLLTRVEAYEITEATVAGALAIDAEHRCTSRGIALSVVTVMPPSGEAMLSELADRLNLQRLPALGGSPS